MGAQDALGQVKHNAPLLRVQMDTFRILLTQIAATAFLVQPPMLHWFTARAHHATVPAPAPMLRVLLDTPQIRLASLRRVAPNATLVMHQWILAQNASSEEDKQIAYLLRVILLDTFRILLTWIRGLAPHAPTSTSLLWIQ